MAQQTQQPLLRGHPLGDPRAVRPPRSVKGSKNKDQSFPGSVRGNAAAKQEPGSTRAASRHHTRAHAGQDTPCSPGSPSVSPRDGCSPLPHGEGDTPSPAGWGERGVSPEPPSATPGSGAGLPAPKSTPQPSPSPPPPLTVLRWGLGSGCGSGGCIPTPGSAPGPAAGAPPLVLRKGRGRGACPGGRGREERRLEQGHGPGAERGREALPGSVRGAGAAGRGGAPAAPNGIRHGAARARRTARISRDLAEAAAGGGAGARKRAATSGGRRGGVRGGASPGGAGPGLGAGPGRREGRLRAGVPSWPRSAPSPRGIFVAFKPSFPGAGQDAVLRARGDSELLHPRPGLPALEKAERGWAVTAAELLFSGC